MSLTFNEAILNAGYCAPPEIISDGEIHRFATDQAKRHSKDGWYISFDDDKGKAGQFGSWRDNTKISWSNGTGRQLTSLELIEIDKKNKIKFEEARKEAVAVGKRAQTIYNAASETGSCGYLTKKGIDAPQGVRFVSAMPAQALGFSGNKFFSGMVVPVYSPSGKMSSLQTIGDDGTKLFLKHGSTHGCWFGIGDWQSAKCVVVAEGLATAQSIYQATELPVLVAFASYNLATVAQMLRHKNALAKIILAVDGDKAGRDNSTLAAQTVKGDLVEAEDGMDWNDVHQRDGLAPIRKAFITDEINILWKTDLIIKKLKDGTQTIPCRVHNLIVMLTNHPDFKGRIRYNEMSNNICIDEVDVEEFAAIKIKAQMEHHFSEKVGTNELTEALVVVAMNNRFHPIKDYLSGLKWDGIRRVNLFFSNYFGADYTEYTDAVSRSFLISAVARIMKPGCQVDTMVIMEGEQGLFKSSALIELFSTKYHSDCTASIGDKDFYQNLRGKWVMEFGEMTTLTRADVNHIKQIITMRSDNYRPSYGKFNKDFPRQSIFCGTTNNDTYLKDATGARRYLPVKCAVISLDDIKRDRDQLWAEAYSLYKAGSTWWEIPGAEEEQTQRFDADSREEIIALWLIGKAGISTTQILTEALNIDVSKQGRAEQSIVGQIMSRLKWKKKFESIGGVRCWRYYRE
jgi:putative DNA primase/helicase